MEAIRVRLQARLTGLVLYAIDVATDAGYGAVPLLIAAPFRWLYELTHARIGEVALDQLFDDGAKIAGTVVFFAMVILTTWEHATGRVRGTT